MTKIGLALSGGGVRGFFHTGFLHAIKERDIAISVISGTSAGAIAGALYAAEVDLIEVTERFPKRMRSLFFEPNMLLKAKFNPTSILRKYVEEFLGDKTFEDLTIPMKINAVNISTGETEYFQSGSIVEAVIAASAIPGVFNSFHSNGNIYVDGGLTANLPSQVIRSDCDFVIGINLLHFQEKQYQKLLTRRQMIQRSVDIYHRHNNLKNIDCCDVLVSPIELCQYPTYDTTNKNELFELGYNTGLKFEFPE